MQLQEYKHIFITIEECRVNGKFINENSINYKIKEAYNFILEHKQEVKNYYNVIGYSLREDIGFFYFVIDIYENIPKTYVKHYIDYIDIYRFLKMLNSNISASDGSIYSIADMENRLNGDIELRTMIDKMTFLKKQLTNRGVIEALVERLKSDGFAETTGSREGKFLILRSFKFIEDIIMEVEVEL